MDFCEIRRDLYLFSYRFRYLLFMLPLIIPIYLALAKWVIPHSVNPAWIQPLIFIEGLFIFLTLIFPAWFSIRFRYLAWWVSQGCGIVFYWLSSGWRRVILLLIGVASALKIRAIFIQSALDNGSQNITSVQNITLNSTFNGTLSGALNGTLNGTLAIAPNGNLSDAVTNSPPWWMDLLMPDFLMKVFAISALFILIKWAYDARRQIVILQFSNLTGDDKLKSSAEGISSVLSNELAWLVNLYLMVDKTDPYVLSAQSKDGSLIDPSFSSEVSEALKNAVTSETKVKLGPLEVPVGAIMGVLGMALSGPRLTGSLHQEDNNLVIIAKISGVGRKGSWQVSSSEISEEIPEEGDSLRRMIRQLAYRIFTDLEEEHIGTPRWRAVCHYTTGLRTYRDTLRTDRDKNPLLRQAERAFLLALGEDKEFLRCYYNLGLVYLALKEHESAYSVLSKAVEPQEPKGRLSNVYYALALNHFQIQEKTRKKIGWENAEYQFTSQLCDQAIKLQPDNVRAWNLKGFVKKRVKEQELKGQLTMGMCQDYWGDEVVPFRGVATALAWREMCLCRLKGDEDVDHKKILLSASCTLNLAVALSYADLPAKNIMKNLLSLHISSYFGKLELCQSIHLTPNDSDLYFELGKVLIGAEKYSEAAKCFEYALKITPEAVFWSYLATAYSMQNLINCKIPKDDHSIYSAFYAYKRAVDYLSGIDEETLRQSREALHKIKKSEKKENCIKKEIQNLKIVQSYKLCGSEKEGGELKKLKDDLDKIHKLNEEVQNHLNKCEDMSDFMRKLERAKDDAGNDEAYRRRLKQLKSTLSGWDWGCAQVLLKLADIEGDIDKASKINEAITLLEKDHPQEIRKQGLHGNLASALMSQKDFGQALYHAQRSVALDPTSSWDRGVLSEVYRGFGSFEEARSQLKIRFSLEPGNPRFLRDISFSQLGFVTISKDNIEEWRTSIDKFIETLSHSLELLESGSLDEKTSSDKILERSLTHFTLATAYHELTEYDKAIYNYNIAMNLVPESNRSHLVAKFNLGEAYFDSKSYTECEKLYQELIDDLGRITKKIYISECTDLICTDLIPGYLMGYQYIESVIEDSIEELYFKEDLKTLEEIASKEMAGKELGIDDVSLGFLMGYACLNLAFSYAERDINLKNGFNLTEKANSYIMQLVEKSRRYNLETVHADRKGWILYKQAKLEDGSQNIKEAIDSLEKAVCMRADPEYYLHLALALEYELEKYEEDDRKTGKAEFQRILNRAFACCDHVEDLDLKKKYTRQSKDIRRRLRRIEKSHQKAIEGNVSKPDQDPTYE